MQDVTPQIGAEAQRIQSYGQKGFTISGQNFTTSVLVTTESTQPWPVTNVAEITEASLASLFAHNPPPEILLIGTGARHQPIPPSQSM